MIKTETNNVIRFGFSRPKSGFMPLSWFIRKLERTEFSHVFIRIENGWANPPVTTIFEASGESVRAQDLWVFVQRTQITHEYGIRVEKAVKKKVVSYALQQMGKPYAIWEVLGIAVVRVAALFNFRMRNPWSKGIAAQKCSELAFNILGEIDERYKSREFLEKTLKLSPLQKHIDADMLGVRDIFEIFKTLEKEKQAFRIQGEWEPSKEQ